MLFVLTLLVNILARRSSSVRSTTGKRMAADVVAPETAQGAAA